ncbi:MAG: MBL fold metallo-hydrolase [Streptosporangiaceae bacterium]
MRPLHETPQRHEWERPGAYAVVPGVHRIPLPLPNDGLRAVNVYAIEDGDRLVLIDSGWALEESRQQLETALASIGYDLGGVKRFLVTHAHRDHYTQATVVRRLFGTRVALGLGEAPTLAVIQSPEGPMPPLLERLAAAGAPELVDQLRSAAPPRDPADREMWADPDEWLHGGMRLQLEHRTLDVIATPGHTRGHVVFRDSAARLLFAGDHVLPHITPSIGFESAPTARALTDYLASLEVVAGLGDSMLLPAHGPVQPTTSGRIAELMEHHRVRLEATLEAVQGGAATGLEVAARLPWTSRERAFADLDIFNQMLAINETVAHLEVLVEQRLVRAREHDGVPHYTAGPVDGETIGTFG